MWIELTNYPNICYIFLLNCDPYILLENHIFRDYDIMKIYFYLAMGLFVGLGWPRMVHATENAESIYARALQASHEDTVKQAVKDLEKIARQHSEPARVLTMIGQLHLQSEKGDDAIKAFRKAVQADTGWVEAHLGLGLAYLDLKNDWRGARSHLQKAVILDSTQAKVYYHLARLYRISETGNAMQAAARVIQIDPDYAPVYLLLGQIYQDDKLDQLAVYYYDQYLKRQPKDQEAAYLFIRSLAESGKKAEAERLLGRLEDPRGYAILGQILMERGNFEDALIAFEEYISTLSEEEGALYWDISIVATPREAATYRQTPPDRRRDFLRRFWLKKDPLKASGGLMRWCEHYRRVLYARENYGRKQFPWDRRGEVYIRYGEPDYRSTSRSLNLNVPQSVGIIQTELARRLYGPDGVHHTFLGPVYPVRTERFINIIDEDNPGLDDLPRMPFEGSMQARAGMAAEDTLGFYGYKPVTTGIAGMTVKWEVWFYTRIGGGIEVVFTDEFTSGRYDYAPPPVLTTEDRDRLERFGHDQTLRISQLFSDYSPATFMSRITRDMPEVYNISYYEPLDFHFDTVDFKGTDNNTEVRVLMGVPTRNLYVQGASDTARVQRRVALINERSGRVYRVQGDVEVMAPRSSKSVLVEEFPMNVPPGDYMLALQVWRPEVDLMGVYQVSVPVVSYNRDTLMVSGIQVARAVAQIDSGTAGQFVRSGFRVEPSPGRIFYRGSSLFIYFEIYNLLRDSFGQTRYEVAYTVRDANHTPMLIRALSGLGRMLSGGNREEVTIRYEQTGTQTKSENFVELDLGDVAPGQHEVVVAVKDLNRDIEVFKTARFYVVDKRGAEAQKK